MAYQTGTATSPVNLLDTIRGFLLSLGWTVNFWGDDVLGTAGDDKWLSVVTPGGNYFNLLADNSGSAISVRGATGYTGGNNRDNQPGQSGGWGTTNGLSGPYAAYYLFGSATYCHVVVEIVTNRFAHFHIGVLEKAGTYTGGEYQSHTYWQYGSTNYQNHINSYNTCPFSAQGYHGQLGQYYRLDVDGSVNNWVWHRSEEPTSRALGFIGGGLVGRLVSRSPNFITAQSILVPSIVIGPRPIGGTCVYGSVKDVRSINIKNLTPKQIITIGSDEWMIFPIIRKGSTTIYEPSSGDTGIAYKKVT